MKVRKWQLIPVCQSLIIADENDKDSNDIEVEEASNESEKSRRSKTNLALKI